MYIRTALIGVDKRLCARGAGAPLGLRVPGGGPGDGGSGGGGSEGGGGANGMASELVADDEDGPSTDISISSSISGAPWLLDEK